MWSWSAPGPPAPRPPSCSRSGATRSPSSTRPRSRARRSAGSTSRPRPRACSIAWGCSRRWTRRGRSRSTACASPRRTAPCSTGSIRPAGGGAGTATTRIAVPREAPRPHPGGAGAGAAGGRARAARVTGLLREGDRVVGVQAEDEDGARVDVGARLVVGADGRASVVARALGLVRPHRLQRLALDPVRERHRGARRSRRDLRRSARLLHPEPGGARPREPEPGGAARARGGRTAGGWRRSSTRGSSSCATCPRGWRGMRAEGPLRVMGPLAYRVGEPRVAGRAGGRRGGLLRSVHRRGALHRAALRRAARGGGAPRAHARRRLGGRARALRGRAGARLRGQGARTRALQLVIAHRRLANAAAHFLRRRPALLATLMGVIGDFIPPRAIWGQVLHSDISRG